MVVLVGCEESGVLRDKLIDLGVFAVSCDIVPSRSSYGPHWQRDIVEVLESLPDKSIDCAFLFPDCTYMAVSGNRWYGKGTSGHHKRIEAVEWTLCLWELAKKKAHRVVLENPVSAIFPELKKRGVSVQYVQPWMFGHGETKKTGFALYNFPKLSPTEIVDGREQRVWKMPPGENRKRDRSETFDGIASALAETLVYLNRL